MLKLCKDDAPRRLEFQSTEFFFIYDKMAYKAEERFLDIYAVC